MAGPTKAEILAELARRGLSVDRSRMISPTEQKSIDDARSSARNSIDVLGDLTRFQDINGQVPTGGLVNNVKNVLARWGGEPNVQQLDEITSRIAPQQRVPGSGTTSDMDLRLFLNASPKVTSAKAANDAIIERGRSEAVRRQQYADFLDKYARENGSLNGAEAAFRAMVGLGTRQNPYSVEQAGDRSTLPRGAYYQSPQGLRRNDNGSRGNPLMDPPRAAAPQAKRESLDDIFGN